MVSLSYGLGPQQCTTSENPTDMTNTYGSRGLELAHDLGKELWEGCSRPPSGCSSCGITHHELKDRMKTLLYYSDMDLGCMSQRAR